MQKEKENIHARLKMLQERRDEGWDKAQEEIDNYFFSKADPNQKNKMKTKKKRRISNEEDLWW